jgi:xanthine dehydrogenase YagS FAD-binding subunit
MKEFTYVLPRSLPEAEAAAKKPGATLKAAGIDLVDRMKERQFQPTEVVNLLLLQPDLGGITADADGSMRIGALATLAQIAASKDFAAEGYAALREAAGEAATPQVRNRATAAGNVLQQARCWYLRSSELHCLHGKDGPSCLAQVGDNRYHSVLGYHDCVRVHPSNLAPALLALDCEYTTQLAGKQQRRRVADLFPLEPKAQLEEHTLLPGEIVIAFHVKAQPKSARSAYRESREKLSFDWATTAAAARVVMDGGVIQEASLVLAAVAPVPLPRPDAAKLLIGQKPSDELFHRVALRAFADARPLSHNAYKVQVGQAIVREVLHATTR